MLNLRTTSGPRPVWRAAVLAGWAVVCAAAAASPGKHTDRDSYDRGARPITGKASVYAGKFAGRKMADGTRMSPDSDSAASKTLPLGTRARVTNVETGRSATVTIRDRGPHVRGRVIDVSPATAQQIGVTRRQGVAQVEVQPLPGSAKAE